MVRMVERDIEFENPDWITITLKIFQDIKNKRITKIETEGTNTIVVLYPENNSKVRFRTEQFLDREPTIIDFSLMMYMCPDGTSKFKYVD